jgi:hypothetical protein
MKTPITSVLLLAAALSASALIPLSAAPKIELPVVFPVRALTATREGGEQIERGTTRADVSWAMRRKARQELSPNVWVYFGYRANLDLANAEACQIVIVTFANDEVVDLQLVNKPAVAVIAANLKPIPSVRNIAGNR